MSFDAFPLDIQTCLLQVRKIINILLLIIVNNYHQFQVKGSKILKSNGRMIVKSGFKVEINNAFSNFMGVGDTCDQFHQN